jgi:hypothetical protein
MALCGNRHFAQNIPQMLFKIYFLEHGFLHFQEDEEGLHLVQTILHATDFFVFSQAVAV